MKHKKIKMFISFLLALVLLVSLPLDIQANAAALEGWILYAVITYLAAMGITFTVAGGVDAMVQAMEEKVNDYETQNNIIDFYDHFRNKNVRLVPSGGSGPDGDPTFNLFFAAGAVVAINEFISWLTSEGGWNLGGSFQNVTSQSTFIAGVRRGDSDTLDEVLATSVVDNGVMVKQGTLLELDWNTDYSFVISPPFNYGQTRLNIHYTSGATSFKGSSIEISKTSTGSVKVYRGDSQSSISFNAKNLYFGDNYSMTDISAIYFVDDENADIIRFGFLMNDGTCFTVTVSSYFLYLSDKVTLSSETVIEIPTEIPDIKPLPNQGVSIKDAIEVPMNDPSLDDWAQLVRDTFEDIGTIPQPVPQVVTDPDYVPPVTPAPSPEPSPEIEDIEDLGLPALGEAIKNKFPFCLPSDLRDLVGLLVAEPVTPKWEVDLYEWFDGKLAGDTTFGIDLAEYEMLGQISRWASVISFSIFLLLITKGMIGW